MVTPDLLELVEAQRNERTSPGPTAVARVTDSAQGTAHSRYSENGDLSDKTIGTSFLHWRKLRLFGVRVVQGLTARERQCLPLSLGWKSSICPPELSAQHMLEGQGTGRCSSCSLGKEHWI